MTNYSCKKCLVLNEILGISKGMHLRATFYDHNNCFTSIQKMPPTKFYIALQCAICDEIHQLYTFLWQSKSMCYIIRSEVGKHYIYMNNSFSNFTLNLNIFVIFIRIYFGVIQKLEYFKFQSK